MLLVKNWLLNNTFFYYFETIVCRRTITIGGGISRVKLFTILFIIDICLQQAIFKWNDDKKLLWKLENKTRKFAGLKLKQLNNHLPSTLFLIKGPRG